MTYKHELKKLVTLAWPLLIAQVTQILMGVSDTIMAGRYSSEDMAAVAIGFSITMPVLFFIQGIILALPPIISRLNGAKQYTQVARASQQCLWLALCFAIPAALSSWFIPDLFNLLPIEAKLRAITIDYVSYILLGVPFFALYQFLRNYCEGLSVAKPSMIIMVLGLLVNIPANYIFIYGKFGLPEFGGAGCGIATSLVFVSMFVATYLYTLKAKAFSRYELYRHFHKPDLAEMWTILKLGFPIAMTLLFEVTLFGVVALLLSPFGAIVVASHQIALNFSALMFMFPLSIGMAASIRVGHLLGENRPRQAKMAVIGGLGLGLCIACLTATMTVVERTYISGLYSIDPQVIELAASLMLLAAMFQFSDAIQVISACALRGYKDTSAMFYITFVAYWLIGLPIGCILALTDWLLPQMYAAGFWIGFICGLSSAAVMLGLRLIVIQRRQQHLYPPLMSE
jgi:multidrug resistance protein, MATE family